MAEAVSDDEDLVVEEGEADVFPDEGMFNAPKGEKNGDEQQQGTAPGEDDNGNNINKNGAEPEVVTPEAISDDTPATPAEDEGDDFGAFESGSSDFLGEVVDAAGDGGADRRETAAAAADAETDEAAAVAVDSDVNRGASNAGIEDKQDENGDNDDDDFGGFETGSSDFMQTEAEEVGLSTGDDDAGGPTEDKLIDSNSDKLDVEPVPAVVKDGDDDFGGFAEAGVSGELIPDEQNQNGVENPADDHVAASVDDDDDDDFGDFEDGASAPLEAEGVGTENETDGAAKPASSSVDDDDDDFGDFEDGGSAPLELEHAESPGNDVGASAASTDEDDFGDFGDFDSAPDPEPQQEVDEDDFGDFDAAPDVAQPAPISAKEPAADAHLGQQEDALVQKARSVFSHVFSRHRVPPTESEGGDDDSPDAAATSAIGTILVRIHAV